MSAELHIPDSSADSRVLELIRGGFLQETETTRVTRNGSEAIVVVLAQKGELAKLLPGNIDL